MIIKALLQQASSQGLDTLDAEVLLAHSLQKNRTYLTTWPDRDIDATVVEHYQRLLARRLQGEPIAYILGYKEFWSLPILVTSDTLIPRADSECWLQWLFDRFADKKSLRVLELGTGSGAIALALAHEKPDWSICAIDNSRAALAVAVKNAKMLSCSQVEWLESNWYDALAGRRFDVIVANPPYIGVEEPHWQQGDLRFEPKTALLSAEQGFSDLAHIIRHARDYLHTQGLLLVEHGYLQGEKVRQFYSVAGFNAVQTQCDYGGQPRWTVGVA